MTYRYTLREKSTGEVWSNALNLISLELGHFRKSENELTGLREQWYYCLKNMKVLTDRPKAFADAVFSRLFNISEFENLPSEIKVEYYRNMTTETDIREQIRYARMQGIEQGIEQGEVKTNIANARRMKELGISEELIFQVTLLRPEEYA